MKQSAIITVAAGLCIGALAVASLPATAMDDRDELRGGVQMSDQKLREKLTPEQYYVTQENGTERAFQNEYWDNHRAGIYLDVVSGEPLFASIHKFDSGSGWPSFTQPLVPDNLVEKKDRGWFTVRTEVRSANADSHLGHVFLLRKFCSAPLHTRRGVGGCRLREVSGALWSRNEGNRPLAAHLTSPLPCCRHGCVIFPRYSEGGEAKGWPLAPNLASSASP